MYMHNVILNNIKNIEQQQVNKEYMHLIGWKYKC